MTYSITLDWLFAGNLFTALFGLGVIIIFIGNFWVLIRHQDEFNLYSFFLTICGAVITTTACFNILYGG